MRRLPAPGHDRRQVEHGAWLSPERLARYAVDAGLAAKIEMLPDPAYWGRQIADVRYVVTARR